MKNAIVVFVFMSAIAAVVMSGTKKCGSVSTKPAGQLKNNNYTVAGSVCEWTFNIPSENATMKHIFFQIMEANLDVNDVVTIKDDDTTLVLVQGQNLTVGMYVSYSLTPTVTLNCSKKEFVRSLEINYNSQNCLSVVEEPSGTMVLPKVSDQLKRAINCTYTMKYSGDVVQYLSITDFNFGSSVLTIRDGGSAKSKKLATHTGKKLIPDVISTSHEITLSLKLDYKTSTPSFAAHFASVDQGCSKMITIDGTSTNTYYFRSPNYPNPYPPLELDCRWIISANTKLYVDFSKFSLPDQSNYVEIRDNRRQDGDLLAFLTNQTFSPTQHIFSMNNGLMIRFSTDSGPSGQGFQGRVVSEMFGGLYRSSGDISLPPNSAGASTTYAYLLQVKPNEQVELTMDDGGTELAPNSQLWIYNGYDEATSTLLDVLVSDHEFYKVVSTSNKMMVLAKGFTGPNSFKASFTGIPYGYHNVSTDDVGIKTVDSQFSGNLSWTIRPLKLSKPDALIALTISKLLLQGQDEVIIYSLINRISPILRFNAANAKATTVYIPINNGTLVEIRRSFKYPTITSIFTASYKVIQPCKATYDLSKSESTVLQSPNYPNEYPLGANCLWTLSVPAGKGIHVYFTDLDTLEAHPINLALSNGTVIASASGSVLPDDIFVNKVDKLQVSFNTPVLNQMGMSASGFKAVVSIIDCGGEMTNSTGKIMTPKYPANVTDSMFCIWRVDIPWNGSTNGSHQHLGFTTNLGFVTSKNLSFKILDGRSVRSENVNNVTAKYGGQSTRNTMMVVYKKTGNGSSLGLSIAYKTLVCSKSNQCGNGICLQDAWRCNGKVECNDGADELNCNVKPKPTSEPSGGSTRKAATGVASYVLAICIILFLVVGIFIGLFAPKLMRKFRNRETYSSFSNIPVVTD